MEAYQDQTNIKSLRQPRNPKLLKKFYKFFKRGTYKRPCRHCNEGGGGGVYNVPPLHLPLESRHLYYYFSPSIEAMILTKLHYYPSRYITLNSSIIFLAAHSYKIIHPLTTCSLTVTSFYSLEASLLHNHLGLRGNSSKVLPLQPITAPVFHQFVPSILIKWEDTRSGSYCKNVFLLKLFCYNVS